MAAIVAQFEAERIRRVDEMVHAGGAALHFGGSFVVDHLPSAAFDAAEGSAGAVIGEALGPEAAPVVGCDLVQVLTTSSKV